MISSSTIKRFIPLILLVILMLIGYLFGVTKYLMFEELKQQHLMLKRFVSEFPIASPLLFILIYIAAIALSLPGGALLSIIGGYLFPQPWGMIYVVIGANIGAVLIFLATRTAFGDALKIQAAPFLKKMQEGFLEDAASYMLFLRLVPLFPFWLVNIAAGCFNVSLRTFVLTTFFGILPGAFLFTQAGAGLGSVLETQGDFEIASIFTFQVKIALIALAIFALIPVIFKQLIKYQRPGR